MLSQDFKSGRCYAELTTSSACAEGWEDDHFDFYALEQPSPPSSPASTVGYARIREQVECMSPDLNLGDQTSLDECALACSRQQDCKFFIYGTVRCSRTLCISSVLTCSELS